MPRRQRRKRVRKDAELATIMAKINNTERKEYFFPFKLMTMYVMAAHRIRPHMMPGMKLYPGVIPINGIDRVGAQMTVVLRK